jgi:N-acetylglucosamine transport system permease protein
MVSVFGTGIAGRRRSIRLGNLPYYVVLGTWAAFTIGLIVWVVLGSFKTNQEVFGSPWSLPSDPITSAIINYTNAWDKAHVGTYLLNSVIVCGASVTLILVLAAPAAYVLSRVAFPGRWAINYYLIAGMGLPVQLIMIPLVVQMSDLKLINTLPGLIIVYSALALPFTTLVLTGFFRTLSRELEDAAAIDGASKFTTFWRIMLPIAAPGLFTAAILNFVEVWNEFLLVLVLISDPGKRTLPLGVYGMKQSMAYMGDWSALFAGIVIVILPATIVFILVSDRMMRGLSLAAGK